MSADAARSRDGDAGGSGGRGGGEAIHGLLALVGGAEWQPGCDFDAELLRRSGSDEVLILPTAAAYEHPERAVATAERWFASLGGRARGLMVLNHAAACDEESAAVVRAASFIYLSGGSPLHLISALKGSAVLSAISDAWRSGAVVAGSSAGAMVLCDPMVDPRGGAFTVGLGLLEQVAVVPHHDSGAGQHLWRILELAPAGVVVAGIPERTALIREPGGAWREAGEGRVTVYLDGQPVSLNALPG
jgi:cyanophycinase